MNPVLIGFLILSSLGLLAQAPKIEEDFAALDKAACHEAARDAAEDAECDAPKDLSGYGSGRPMFGGCFPGMLPQECRR